jgi:hypothetical protein
MTALQEFKRLHEQSDRSFFFLHVCHRDHFTKNNTVSDSLLRIYLERKNNNDQKKTLTI